jgi:hypothetical protein
MSKICTGTVFSFCILATSFPSATSALTYLCYTSLLLTVCTFLVYIKRYRSCR